MPNYTDKDETTVKKEILDAVKEKEKSSGNSFDFNEKQIVTEEPVESDKPALQVLKIEMAEKSLTDEYGEKKEIAEGDVVYHDAMLYLTVSRGDGKDVLFKVEKDFTGKTYTAAKKYFEKQKAACTMQEKYDDKVPKGKIIRQDGSVGEYRSSSNPVVFIVSKGPKTVPMPDLIGFSRDRAISKLKKLKLKYSITEEYSNSTKGTVIRQGKKENARVKPGTKIAIVVSMGAAPQANQTPQQTQTYTPPQPQAQAPSTSAPTRGKSPDPPAPSPSVSGGSSGGIQ